MSYERDKEYGRRYRKAYCDSHPGFIKAASRRRLDRIQADPVRHADFKAKQVVIQARNRAKLKADAIKAYGGKCKCCKEKDIRFLTIDHIEGGGTKHRRELGGGRKVSSRGFYLMLRRESYPKGYQVLCWSCNCGRALNGGICPHQKGT